MVVVVCAMRLMALANTLKFLPSQSRTERLATALRIHSRMTEAAQRPLYGIGLMVIAIGFYAVQDAVTKYLTADYSAFQILFFRAGGVFMTMLPLLARLPVAAWRTRQPKMMALRCAAGVMSMICYILAYRTMSLADVAAIGFSGVLMVTALSMLLLGEKVDWHRWGAVIAGFIGVIIILRPGSGLISTGAAWPLLGAVGFTGMTLSLRVLIRTDHPVAITATFALFIVALMSAVMPFVWRMPDLDAFALLIEQGIMCGVGQLLMTKSLQVAPASVVSPITYTIIVYGIVIGYVWFGDVPDPMMLLGAAMLIASCLYIARRERATA